MTLFKIALTIHDSRDVMKKLKDADFNNADWRKLGEELGLRKGTLDRIEKEHQGDIDKCFDECLSNWLLRNDDVDACHGKPTYNSLEKALKEIDMVAVADNIRK